MPADRSAAFPLGAAVTIGQLERDPHPVLARLRSSEPVSWLPALDGWLVTRRDLAMAAMRDTAALTVDDARFSTGRVVGPSMLSRDGTEHDRHRAPFARPWRRDAIRGRFEAPVAEEVDRLVDALPPSGPVELRRALAGPLAAAMMSHALGLGGTDVATVLRWYDAIVDAVTQVTAGRPVTAAGRAGFAELRDVLAATLDGPSPLATAVGGLSREEVVSNAAVLLFGGIETTEGMIANAVWHLLGAPDALARVRADPDRLLPNAIEESLRLEPAAATIDRYATADLRLGDAAIAAGDLVTISIAAANRDPAAFTDPDRFDVARANARQHVAFAHGPHVCLGMHLARLEAHAAVGRLLERLPGLRLDPARPVTPRGLVFRKPPELWVLPDGVSPAAASPSR